MKFKTIVKNKYIENTIDANTPYLFTIGCPTMLKSFIFNGNICINTINENGNYTPIFPETFTAKIFSDMRITSDTKPIYEFKFHIGKETIINKKFNDGHTIMIFADIPKSETYSGVFVTINIDSIMTRG